MINFWKKQKEIDKMLFEDEVEFGVTRSGEVFPCQAKPCSECIFDGYHCELERMKWLVSEYEPELTEEDKAFLKLMSGEGFNWVIRGNYCLYASENKPIESENKKPDWKFTKGKRYTTEFVNQDGQYKKLFLKNLEDSEPYSIAELLGEKE